MSRHLAVLLTAGALLWGAVVVASPYLLAGRHGATSVSAVYLGASRICHQRPERSFRSAGITWPVCARCSGLYLAGAAGALLGWVIGRFVRRDRYRAAMFVAGIPTAVTWALEAAGLMPFSNLARFSAALPLGLFAGWVFVRLLRYDAALDGSQIDRSGSLAGSH